MQSEIKPKPIITRFFDNRTRIPALHAGYTQVFASGFHWFIELPVHFMIARHTVENYSIDLEYIAIHRYWILVFTKI